MIKLLIKDINPDYTGRDIAFADIEGFEEVETLEDSGYKDYAPARTILKRESDGTFWAYDWERYTEYYGSGSHEFPNDYLVQVERKEKVVVKHYWEALK